MKTFRVMVTYQPKKQSWVEHLTYHEVKASSARVAINYGIGAACRKYCTDSELRGATVSEVKEPK